MFGLYITSISLAEIGPRYEPDEFGDTTLSLFASPVKPAAGRLIWDAGPVALIPTASDDRLSPIPGRLVSRFLSDLPREPEWPE